MYIFYYPVTEMEGGEISTFCVLRNDTLGVHRFAEKLISKILKMVCGTY